MHRTAGTSAQQTPISEHFDGQRFFNPHAPNGRSRREVHQWQRSRRKAPWPEHIEDPILPPPDRTAQTTLSATFIGHSTFFLQIGGVCVLTDPIWSDRCSPVNFAGPRRVRRPGQSLDALPIVDLLLVSHNHYDHLDLPTLRRVRTRWSPCAATGLGNARHLAKAGIRSTVELDWWQSTELRGTRITYVPPSIFLRVDYTTGTTVYGVGSSSKSEESWSISLEILATARTSQKSGANFHASISHSFRSGPMSHDGSCADITWTHRKRCRRTST